ncbi:MAG: DUF2167 domain-containing protein [Myxococcota bacterium]
MRIFAPHSIALPLLLLSVPAWAEDPTPEAPGTPEEKDPLDQFKWQTTGKGSLGKAEVAIPEGLRFLGARDTSTLVEMMGNISGHEEAGLIGTPDLSWFVVFFFDDVGYVKDDEKDSLDADKMAATMREHLVESNEERRRRHLDELSFDGWAIAPRYNAESKQLEWAQKLRSVKGTSVNYNTRVLGRHGVMRVTLVTGPEDLEAVLPAFHDMMKGFQFNGGEDYASFRAGDKVAEYGLIALVAGGAGAVAAKTGLLSAAVIFLKKGAKLIAVAIAGLAAAVKKFFTRKPQ